MQVSLNDKLEKDTFLKLNMVLYGDYALDVKSLVVWHKMISGRNVYGVNFNNLLDMDREKFFNSSGDSLREIIAYVLWKILSKKREVRLWQE